MNFSAPVEFTILRVNASGGVERSTVVVLLLIMTISILTASFCLNKVPLVLTLKMTLLPLTSA